MIAQHALRRATIRAPSGSVRSGAVLPFFGADLEVRFLLVMLMDGRAVVVRDLPDRVDGHVLAYAREPRLDRDLARKRPPDLVRLFHFDPWWLLKGRERIPGKTRRLAVRKKLSLGPPRSGAVRHLCTGAGFRRRLSGDLRRVWFGAGLRRVAAARTASRRLGLADLRAVLRGGPRG